jgi:glucosylceramidase
MKLRLYLLSLTICAAALSCDTKPTDLTVEIYESSASGNKLKRLNNFSLNAEPIAIKLKHEEVYQTITGFGGAFTESSAYLLNQLGDENRSKVLQAYFGPDGANYSLTRTHINSCDFSLGNYSYAPIAGDIMLENFTIDEDRDDLIPMIKDAMAISEDGFKILASPWTAPPWMKDNKDWKGGKLLPEYYETWALYFSKYIDAYKEEGIKIWGLTAENEPLGNDSNWESMHFTAEEMTDFVQHHLGPKLEADGHDVKILGYDQNRDKELEEFVGSMYADEASSKYFDGTAVHWYASTVDYFPEYLNMAHEAAPDKYLIQSEACIDSEVPHWEEDAWYWSKEATDWGWDWAPEELKKDHPKYVPVYRYARDIIGSLNNWVDGWIDWNMVLDKQGGPNWASNWCIAPIIVDPENDEVYFTPIYEIMVHFSKFIRPGAIRIGFEHSDEDLMVTAAKNPDGSIAIVVLNMGTATKDLSIELEGLSKDFQISAQAIQTVVIPAA